MSPATVTAVGSPRAMKWFLVGMLIATGGEPAAAQLSSLLPVDEAVQRPDFFSFRAQLQAAIARRDVDFVMAVVDPNIKASLGGDDGMDAFRRIWQPAAPGSTLWGELARVLALGGSFQGDQAFVAPYTFSKWPDKLDSFEHVAVIASNVRIRAEPRADAPVIATSSFAILALARDAKADPDQSWTAVLLEGKKVGYVSSALVRSPIDHRAFFSSASGRWRLVMFLAGD